MSALKQIVANINSSGENPTHSLTNFNHHYGTPDYHMNKKDVIHHNKMHKEMINAINHHLKTNGLSGTHKIVSHSTGVEHAGRGDHSVTHRFNVHSNDGRHTARIDVSSPENSDNINKRSYANIRSLKTNNGDEVYHNVHGDSLNHNKILNKLLRMHNFDKEN